MSDFLGGPPRSRRAGTRSTHARNDRHSFLVAFVVTILYVGREVLIPIAMAIVLSFVLSPPILLLRRWGLGRVPSVLAVVLAALVILNAPSRQGIALQTWPEVVAAR